MQNISLWVASVPCSNICLIIFMLIFQENFISTQLENNVGHSLVPGKKTLETEKLFTFVNWDKNWDKLQHAVSGETNIFEQNSFSVFLIVLVPTR